MTVARTRKKDPFAAGPIEPIPVPRLTPLASRKRRDPFADPEPEPEAKPEPEKWVPVRVPKKEAEYRSAIYGQESLSADAVLLGVTIGHHYFGDGKKKNWELYASQKTLAKKAHIPETSLKRVRNALRELEEAGFLRFLERLPDQRLKYRITVPLK